ncbi:MAG: hypothetical protein JW737_05450, partial [Acidobacteria bacterium]|nr:hypothetical protein [Acidobacteriota bacterium]
EFTAPPTPQPVPPPPQPPIQFGQNEPEQIPQPPLDFGQQVPGVQTPPPVSPEPPSFEAAAPPIFDEQPPAPPVFEASAPTPEPPSASPVPPLPEIPVIEESAPSQPPIIEEDAGMPVLDDTPFGVGPSAHIKAAPTPPPPVQPIDSRMEELSQDASEAGKELSEAFFTPAGDIEEDNIFSLDESSLDDEEAINMPQMTELDREMPDLSEQPSMAADFTSPSPEPPVAPAEIFQEPEPAAPEMEIPQTPQQPIIPDFADAMGDVSIAFNKLSNQPGSPTAHPRPGAAQEATAVPSLDQHSDDASIFSDTTDVDLSPEISSLVEEAGITSQPAESIPLSQQQPNGQIPKPQPAASVSADQGSGDNSDIVAKVTESVLSKISSDVIREIAWEVVPEIVDRILKEKQGQ